MMPGGSGSDQPAVHPMGATPCSVMALGGASEAAKQGVVVQPLDVESQAPPEPPVDLGGLDPGQLATLTWKNVVVRVRDAKGKERQLLKGVTGSVEPGEMLAIMGPSGCGKTTLLDTLAGRLGRGVEQEGDVLVNGHPAQVKYGASAYVTQDDVLIAALTVRESINFSAKLRLPLSMPAKDKTAVVDHVLAELGLQEAQNTLIGGGIIRGVSGGQRRRVSIGMELVTGPRLLFLDEPTSGLDAASAFYVISHVRRLARGGRTVLSVIHQPSAEVFELFDQLCLLSAGSLIYYGPTMGAVSHFEQAGLPVPPQRNPADHFLHTINRDFSDVEDVDKRINCLVNFFDKGHLNDSLNERVSKLTATPGPQFEAREQHPPAWHQTLTLTHRNAINMMRNVGLYWLRLGMYLMLCLALGLIFLNMDMTWNAVFNRMALLFFVVGFLTFMSVAGFPAFVEDMKVFMRERLNGYYGVMSFVVANTVASAPFILLIAVLSTVIMYFWTNLNTEADRVIYFILNLFLALMVAESIMMAIAPVVPSFLMGIAAGAGLLGIFMLCCGFFTYRTELTAPVFRYPLYYIGFHTYSFHGMMQNEFHGMDGFGCPCSIQPGSCADPSCTISGEQILDVYSFYGYSRWWDLAILSGMVFVYRGLFYVTLKLKERMSG